VRRLNWVIKPLSNVSVGSEAHRMPKGLSPLRNEKEQIKENKRIKDCIASVDI
jgi:hypothetical protein